MALFLWSSSFFVSSLGISLSIFSSQLASTQVKGLLSSRNGRPLFALQTKGCMSEDQVNRQTCDFSYLMDIGTVKTSRSFLFDVYREFILVHQALEEWHIWVTKGLFCLQTDILITGSYSKTYHNITKIRKRLKFKLFYPAIP